MHEPEILAGEFVRRRTKKERIKTIQKRIEYLESIIEINRKENKPYGYYSEERDALRWALSILIPYSQKTLIFRFIRDESTPNINTK